MPHTTGRAYPSRPGHMRPKAGSTAKLERLPIRIKQSEKPRKPKAKQ